jgi:hypothetical protein
VTPRTDSDEGVENYEEVVGGHAWIQTPPIMRRNEEIKANIYREKLIFLNRFRNLIAVRNIPKSLGENPSKATRFHFCVFFSRLF